MNPRRGAWRRRAGAARRFDENFRVLDNRAGAVDDADFNGGNGREQDEISQKEDRTKCEEHADSDQN